MSTRRLGTEVVELADATQRLSERLETVKRTRQVTYATVDTSARADGLVRVRQMAETVAHVDVGTAGVLDREILSWCDQWVARLDAERADHAIAIGDLQADARDILSVAYQLHAAVHRRLGNMRIVQSAAYEQVTGQSGSSAGLDDVTMCPSSVASEPDVDASGGEDDDGSLRSLPGGRGTS